MFDTCWVRGGFVTPRHTIVSISRVVGNRDGLPQASQQIRVSENARCVTMLLHR